MSQHDRARWDARYADPCHKLTRGPNTLLQRYAPPVQASARPLRALELACGLGLNAVWLGEQGYTVHALDISLAALQQARNLTRRSNLHNVTFIQADLDTFPLPVGAYDLALVFRFLDRRLFPALCASVRPGGTVIYQTLNTGHLDRSPHTRPAHMLELGELPGHFPGWTVIDAEDGPYLSSFVGRKPERDA